MRGPRPGAETITSIMGLPIDCGYYSGALKPARSISKRRERCSPYRYSRAHPASHIRDRRGANPRVTIAGYGVADIAHWPLTGLCLGWHADCMLCGRRGGTCRGEGNDTGLFLQIDGEQPGHTLIIRGL